MCIVLCVSSDGHEEEEMEEYTGKNGATHRIKVTDRASRHNCACISARAKWEAEGYEFIEWGSDWTKGKEKSCYGYFRKAGAAPVVDHVDTAVDVQAPEMRTFTGCTPVGQTFTERSTGRAFRSVRVYRKCDECGGEAPLHRSCPRCGESVMLHTVTEGVAA